MPRIVIVDQESRVHEALTSVLAPMGHEVFAFRTPALAAVQLRREPPEIVIAESENGGIALIEELREAELPTVVMLTCSLPKKDLALEALRAGAYDLFIKPLNVRDFVKSINRALSEEAASSAEPAVDTLSPLCLTGDSAAARTLRKQVDAVAGGGGRVPVLVQGPLGSGKQEVVRHLHGILKGATAPLVTVSCLDLDEKGLRDRFLGSDGNPGPAFIEAVGGTLVIDCVDHLPEALQEEIAPLIKPASRDCWIVTTSGTDLDEALADGKFSVKFYFQISSKVIEIPGLEKRKDDLPQLIEEIQMRSTQIPEQARHVTFEPAAIERLKVQDWTKNLYALEKIVVAAVGECKGGAVREADLARPLRSLNAD